MSYPNALDNTGLRKAIRGYGSVGICKLCCQPEKKNGVYCSDVLFEDSGGGYKRDIPWALPYKSIAPEYEHYTMAESRGRGWKKAHADYFKNGKKYQVYAYYALVGTATQSSYVLTGLAEDTMGVEALVQARKLKKLSKKTELKAACLWGAFARVDPAADKVLHNEVPGNVASKIIIRGLNTEKKDADSIDDCGIGDILISVNPLSPKTTDTHYALQTLSNWEFTNARCRINLFGPHSTLRVTRHQKAEHQTYAKSDSVIAAGYGGKEDYLVQGAYGMSNKYLKTNAGKNEMRRYLRQDKHVNGPKAGSIYKGMVMPADERVPLAGALINNYMTEALCAWLDAQASASAQSGIIRAQRFLVADEELWQKNYEGDIKAIGVALDKVAKPTWTDTTLPAAQAVVFSALDGIASMVEKLNTRMNQVIENLRNNDQIIVNEVNALTQAYEGSIVTYGRGPGFDKTVKSTSLITSGSGAGKFKGGYYLWNSTGRPFKPVVGYPYDPNQGSHKQLGRTKRWFIDSSWFDLRGKYTEKSSGVFIWEPKASTTGGATRISNGIDYKADEILGRAKSTSLVSKGGKKTGAVQDSYGGRHLYNFTKSPRPDQWKCTSNLISINPVSCDPFENARLRLDSIEEYDTFWPMVGTNADWGQVFDFRDQRTHWWQW